MAVYQAQFKEPILMVMLPQIGEAGSTIKRLGPALFEIEAEQPPVISGAVVTEME